MSDVYSKSKSPLSISISAAPCTQCSANMSLLSHCNPVTPSALLTPDWPPSPPAAYWPLHSPDTRTSLETWTRRTEEAVPGQIRHSDSQWLLSLVWNYYTLDFPIYSMISVENGARKVVNDISTCLTKFNAILLQWKRQILRIHNLGQGYLQS